MLLLPYRTTYEHNSRSPNYKIEEKLKRRRKERVKKANSSGKSKRKKNDRMNIP